jgi:esterase/lipase
MTMWKRWIQRSVLCGLLLGGVVGYAMASSPPVDQIAQNDHAAIAAWYDTEVANLRQKVKDMTAMREVYRKNPMYAHSAMGGSHKTDAVQHCDTLINMYTKAAKEADELAQGHRDMLKK